MSASLVPILLLMTLLGSVGAIFLKSAASDGLIMALARPAFWGGGALYVGGALLNIYLLKYVAYSVLLPMTALTYVWTFVLSAIFLGESVVIGKILGLVSIIAGVTLLALR